MHLCAWLLAASACGTRKDLGDYEVERASQTADSGITVDDTWTVPPGFVRAEAGGYKLGPPVNGAGVVDTGYSLKEGGCEVLVGVVRDFKGRLEPDGHPDFESFSGRSAGNNGIVLPALGEDKKPVFALACGADAGVCSAPVTGRERFDQWYHYTEGINQPFLVYLSFKRGGAGGADTFQSDLFFPLDNAGFGDSGTGEDKNMHNFGFTTELHTSFRYRGGEKFSFAGDDDLWVFINGKLAIDLGGLHQALADTVDLDASAEALGITRGQVYALDLFHAERHTTASHFRVDTTLAFVDCGVVPPDVR